MTTSRSNPARIRPPQQTSDPVYSNYNHELQADLVAALERDLSLCAQHAAWNFCGYIWREAGRWVEQLWVHGALVAEIEGEEILTVIEQANDTYGWE